MKYNGVYASRWEILKRDDFTCQYCGQHAPDVILHIDHRQPRAVGGSNEPDNLVTACAACNIGKHMDGLRPSSIPHRKPILEDEITEYLAEQGPATTTQITKAIGRNRSNVSTKLNNSPLFARVGRIKAKRGASVVYTLS